MRRCGFTIIELLVVIAIIAVFIVVGIPMFNRYTVKNDLKTKTEEIRTLLETAQGFSNNPRQGYKSAVVRYEDDSFKMYYLTDTNYCEIPSTYNFNGQKIVSEINTEKFIIGNVSKNNWYCFSVDGSHAFFDGVKIMPDFPQNISINSKSYQELEIGPSFTVDIVKVNEGETGFKFLFHSE